MTLTETLVDWAWELRPDDLPEAVRRAAARHLLDGMGVAVAAARSGAVPYARQVAAGFTEPAEATILTDGRRAPAAMAALAGGALVHGLDYDDTHAAGLVHATAVVMPTAFAMAQRHGATGAEVLTAAVAGYETVTRLGAAVRHGFHRRGFHATSVCGVLAATLVAARLSGADRATAVNALGVAGSQASGLLEFLHTGASTKQLHPGFAAMNGVLAADLARHGASGPASVLEGDAGLYAAFTGEREGLDRVTEGLGGRWETGAISIKPYPACQLSHAALDALAAIAAELAPPDVAAMTFDVPADSVPVVCEPLAAKRRPTTPYEAKFSLPWSAAALLVEGGLGVATFDEGNLARRDVADLAARVGYRAVDPGVAAADAPGRVEVTLVDGRRLVSTVPTSRGTPASPLDDAEVVAKLERNCGGASPELERLVERVRLLAEQPTVEDVVAATVTLAGRPLERPAAGTSAAG